MRSSEPIHLCHARACEVEVPPRMLMCRKHWRMVPVELQRRVWALYRAGQENDKRPTRAYLEAAAAAVEAVAKIEAKLCPICKVDLRVSAHTPNCKTRELRLPGL